MPPAESLPYAGRVEVVSHLAKAPRPGHLCALICRLFLLGGLLLACAASAGPIKLDSLKAGSRVFKNVTVLGINSTDIYFTHDGGITSVRLKYLEPKLQKRFNYDPEAAAYAEKQQAVDDALYMESVASNIVAKAQQAILAAQKAALTSEDNLADPISDRSLIGKPAPTIKGGKWLGEKPVLEGKLVLITFWAPWSIPCKKYIPELNALQKKFAAKLAVVGVTSESEAEIADMTDPKVDFPSVIDPKAKFAATVGVTSIPYVMLIDPKGVVRYQGHPTAITEKQVEKIMARLAEQATTP